MAWCDIISRVGLVIKRSKVQLPAEIMGKLFTSMSFCHQTVPFATGLRTVMRMPWCYIYTTSKLAIYWKSTSYHTVICYWRDNLLSMPRCDLTRQTSCSCQREYFRNFSRSMTPHVCYRLLSPVPVPQLLPVIVKLSYVNFIKSTSDCTRIWYRHNKNREQYRYMQIKYNWL